MPQNSLTVTDNRTGKYYELPITHGSIQAMDLRQIKVSEDDFGLMSYDPAFTNTASCQSRITFIDGEQGILRYRGYPIEQLTKQQSTYLETAYLILHGELPTIAQLNEWTAQVTHHTLVPENMKKILDGFHQDAHPMSILMSMVEALSTFYPEANNVLDSEVRQRQIVRLIAKLPTLAAFIYRHSRGLPYVYPDNILTYPGNFLHMMFQMTQIEFKSDPTIEHAIEVLFILHADHEQNCSANTMRGVGSAHSDPYSAVAAAIAALSGPLHGGANAAVLQMLGEIGSKEGVSAFIKTVKAGEARLSGFGHRVYKNYDPRARIIKSVADEVFAVTGKNPLLDIAQELEKIALEDDYFVERQLYPNVDFYSGLIYQATGFPVEMFPVLFALARTAGWLAQWQEMIADEDQKIARPRQVYTGHGARDYIACEQRATV